MSRNVGIPCTISGIVKEYLGCFGKYEVIGPLQLHELFYARLLIIASTTMVGGYKPINFKKAYLSIFS